MRGAVIAAAAATGWPALLPPPPALAFRVTPAGLLEWCGGTELPAEADLVVRVDASNPLLLSARAMAGDMPQVAIDGDAQLAADVNWLLQNLRWDVAADLERLFGPRRGLSAAPAGLGAGARPARGAAGAHRA